MRPRALTAGNLSQSACSPIGTRAVHLVTREPHPDFIDNTRIRPIHPRSDVAAGGHRFDPRWLHRTNSLLISAQGARMTPKSCVYVAPAWPSANETGACGLTPTPVLRKPGWRMLARCVGDAIQPATIDRGVASESVLQAMSSATS